MQVIALGLRVIGLVLLDVSTTGKRGARDIQDLARPDIRERIHAIAHQGCEQVEPEALGSRAIGGIELGPRAISPGSSINVQNQPVIQARVQGVVTRALGICNDAPLLGLGAIARVLLQACTLIGRRSRYVQELARVDVLQGVVVT